MAYDIRRLSFSEVLDRAFRVLVDNFLLLVAIAAIWRVPMALIAPTGGFNAGYNAGYQAASAGVGPALLAILVGLILVFAGPLFHAAMTVAIAEIYTDRPVTIGSAYRSAWKIYWPFLGTYFLLGLLIGLIAGVPAALLGLALSPTLKGFGVVLAVMVAIVISAYLVVRWCLIGPVMIVEQKFAFKAMTRGGELIRGSWWQAWGLLIVAGLIVGIPAGVLNLVWSAIPLLGRVLSGLTLSVATAYSATALMVYYFDRRCRVEDFDIHHLAAQIQAEGGPAAAGASSVG